MDFKPDELTHHGVRGMKWGVRRYQNKDGSLTAMGRKQRGILGGNVFKKKEKKVKPEKTSTKKKASQLSDEDLVKAINRARLEDTYNSLRPEKKSTVKKFRESFIDDALIPATVSAGKKFINDALDKFGKNLLKDAVDPNSLEGLKERAEKLKYMNEIARRERDGADDDLTWKDKEIRQKVLGKEKDAELDDLRRKIAIKEAKEKLYGKETNKPGDSSKTGEGKVESKALVELPKIKVGDKKFDELAKDRTFTTDDIKDGFNKIRDKFKRSEKNSEREIYDGPYEILDPIDKDKRSSNKSSTGSDVYYSKPGEYSDAGYKYLLGSGKRSDASSTVKTPISGLLPASKTRGADYVAELSGTKISGLLPAPKPSNSNGTSASTISRIKSLSNSSSDYTVNEIASKLGISPSTVSKYSSDGKDYVKKQSNSVFDFDPDDPFKQFRVWEDD